ncbi:MAG: hypothetical protein A3F04_02245 [Candidatus Chisholmbacteria bacterium RIFCSPHIGHO2_12_FULL_49_9]|uniref:Uncharacterized protein n=1 Tax=Candidatus Chisholmbacteria bacterium RIFCSPHIGHO2_01_FULL_52_32 TaxID=1797591 RepID=A0A1G1VRW1_9BACT|nr:MAG: hypothetical protein A2786_01325 [Candidatus Chisholmbacteria bacterium RIFCSPHIGHO2_01_FULL_52_32]OGY19256.1 MAG: hypothetical protein A3F04_02245 [Candidatus Chisholmbacteria bacterium RIFCSPHIGHO2_12_FULL_49_9]OGY20484.1 MAG: hypothetical protein A2900_05420 [Candidatus Chisholmbacteria bacterium RIFCSPLOWO2_01_FULL_50_28]
MRRFLDFGWENCRIAGKMGDLEEAKQRYLARKQAEEAEQRAVETERKAALDLKSTQVAEEWRHHEATFKDQILPALVGIEDDFWKNHLSPQVLGLFDDAAKEIARREQIAMNRRIYFDHGVDLRVERAPDVTTAYQRYKRDMTLLGHYLYGNYEFKERLDLKHLISLWESGELMHLPVTMLVSFGKVGRPIPPTIDIVGGGSTFEVSFRVERDGVVRWGWGDLSDELGERKFQEYNGDFHTLADQLWAGIEKRIYMKTYNIRGGVARDGDEQGWA